MSTGAGIALIAVGAVIAFTFTGDFVGVDPDILGFGLMLAGGVVLVGALLRRRRSGQPRRRS